MAFNYQVLKNLSGQSLIPATVTASVVANSTLSGYDPAVNTNGQVATSAITSTKLAANSVNLQGSAITGTLQIGTGGLGTNTPLGGAYNALYSNGSSLTSSPHGIQGIQVFTGSGTWNKPSGVRWIKVQVLGAGGGGSGHGEGGGAGGYAEKYLDVRGISSVSVSVGGGGGGTYYHNTGGDGSGSSFGPYVSAGGGYGANRQNQHSGGVSGGGSGGDLNIHQGGGLSHHSYDSQAPSTTFFGGGAPSSHPQGGHFAHNHQGHSAPGTGGAGAHFHGHRGSDGRPGIIIITHYY